MDGSNALSIYNIESWHDSYGNLCYSGAIIEYEDDILCALSGGKAATKLYGKIAQSEYGWWGFLTPEQDSKDRPNPIWTVILDTRGFRVLDKEEGEEKWKSQIQKNIK